MAIVLPLYCTGKKEKDRLWRRIGLTPTYSLKHQWGRELVIGISCWTGREMVQSDLYVSARSLSFINICIFTNPWTPCDQKSTLWISWKWGVIFKFFDFRWFWEVRSIFKWWILFILFLFICIFTFLFCYSLPGTPGSLSHFHCQKRDNIKRSCHFLQGKIDCSGT